MQEIIIIPDVHGRNFWRTAAGLVKKHHLVFLGDYLDPYPGEGISSYTAYEELEEIVILKEKYPGNVTLLLGNHDLHYLAPKPGGCRFDWSRNSRILCNHLTPFSKISAPKHVFFASGYCFSQILWLYL